MSPISEVKLKAQEAFCTEACSSTISWISKLWQLLTQIDRSFLHLNLRPVENYDQVQGTHSPLWVKISSFSCNFREKIGQTVGWHPLRGWQRPVGNPGSTTDGLQKQVSVSPWDNHWFHSSITDIGYHMKNGHLKQTSWSERTVLKYDWLKVTYKIQISPCVFWEVCSIYTSGHWLK